jgi:hypothetical protein
VVADPPGATGTAIAADETASDAAINASLRPANAGTFLMVYLLAGRTNGVKRNVRRTPVFGMPAPTGVNGIPILPDV